MVKNSPVMQETWVQPVGWEDPLEKGMVTHSSVLAWRFHERRSLVGFSPWGLKEQYTAQQLILLSSPLSIGLLDFLLNHGGRMRPERALTSDCPFS